MLRLWGKGRNNWWCAICGEMYDWKKPNRLLVVQKGESVNQAKVFRAHAVPQGLCGSLINALKLLANQEEDGDGLIIQNIVTNLGEGNRKGLTNGLRDFIKIDNHRALEVGYLNEGLGKFKVRRPKGSEGYPEVTVRESPDELTLRAEEVCTWKSYINVDHKEKERWRPHLVRAFRCSKKKLSRAVGVKKPQEAQKAKALWKMKAAKDAGEEYDDPTHKDLRGRNETRLALWEMAPQRSNCYAG